MSAYRMISAEKATGFPLSVACALLGVSRSAYYDWERGAPSDRSLTDAWLFEQITAIHAAHRGVYGWRRIHAELRLGRGVRVSAKRVRRRMRRAGISGLVRRKRGRTTIQVPGVRVADDLVERQLRPPGPNVLGVADLTYLRTWEGWVYLAAVQDAYSRTAESFPDSLASEQQRGCVRPAPPALPLFVRLCPKRVGRGTVPSGEENGLDLGHGCVAWPCTHL